MSPAPNKKSYDSNGGSSFSNSPPNSPQTPSRSMSTIERAEQERDDALQILLAFGPAFARSGKFWRAASYAAILGVVTGFMGLGFFNGFTYTFDYWTGDDEHDPNSYMSWLKSGVYDFGSGKYEWLWVTTGGGFIIGLMRLIPIFPKSVDGLFREVRDLHVDPKSAPLIFISSCISLAVGASVGPEAAMGNLGGALGTLLGEKRKLSDRRRAISAFTGMAGAMGALFPSPILSVLLIHELSITSRPADTRFNAAVTTPLVSFVEGQEVNAQHDFMEQVCLSGIAASSAYAVFYGLAEKTFLTPMKLPFAMYALSDYQVWHLAAAIPLGIISGLIGIIALICIGLFRKVNTRLLARMKNRGISNAFATVFMPTLGGVIIGLIAKAYPLTLGDGAMQLKYVIQNSYSGNFTFSDTIKGIDIEKNFQIHGTVTASSLVGTLFAKILAMAISLGFGFVGGQIFPCIFAGTCAGCAITILYPTLPITLTVPCMMAAVPSAFAPIPFSLVGIVILSFVIDGEMTAPVFIATFVSFLTNCGLGVIQGMLERQNSLPGIMTKLRNNNDHSDYNIGKDAEGLSFSYGLLTGDANKGGGDGGGKKTLKNNHNQKHHNDNHNNHNNNHNNNNNNNNNNNSVKFMNSSSLQDVSAIIFYGEDE